MTEELDQRHVATASYMEEMLAELATIGKSMNADFLVFLLEMAQHEARNILRAGPTPGRPTADPDLQASEKQNLSAVELATLFARKTKDQN